MKQEDSLRWLDAFDRVLKLLCLALGGLLLGFMMLFGSFNVLVMRKALNNPIVGTEDLLILSLVVVAAISIPFGGRVGAHIEIEVLERFFPRWFDLASLLLLRLVGAALMVVMTWQLIEAGHNAERFGETTQQLLIPYGPFYYILAACVALYGVVLAMDIAQLLLRGGIRQIRLGDDDMGGFE
jgi:TRAP-type C4-dicarboxylate transport system permease small subunit